MILMDYNPIFIGALRAQVNASSDQEINLDVVRHMVLNTIRFYRMKYKSTYGELVLCADAKISWRKEAFPYYKANRKKLRDQSNIDWSLMLKYLDQIREELINFFPYKVIHIDRCEADDIISVLTLYAYEQTQEPVLIVSADKDFIQLHKYGKVKQFSPILKKFITTDDPTQFLREHILKGDKGDGIPSILNPDNSLAVGTRQKPLRQTKIDELLKEGVASYEGDIERNWKRNNQLINLQMVPSNLRNDIIDAYAMKPLGKRNQLFSYFQQHKLTQLAHAISDF